MKDNNKLRWGILSTAKIGREKVIPAMQQGTRCKITAIASRSYDRAAKTADSLNIPQAYGSYEQLLADAEVEAIYNPLPNHLHIPWTEKALKAGKHVLCEKPIGLSTGDAENLIEEAARNPQLKVMEAVMYKHHPRWIEAKELINSGELGEIKYIHSLFTYFNNDATNIRNQPDIRGVGLMDIGCYCISAPRFLLGEEPQKVMGEMDVDSEFGIDWRTSALMKFRQASASFTCSTQMKRYQKVTVIGTEGTMEIPVPFNPPTDKPTSLFIQKKAGMDEITFEACNHYTIQGELFSQAVLEDSEVPTPLDDALGNMQVLEAIKQSNQEDQWVRC